MFALSEAAAREGVAPPPVVDGLFKRMNPESSFSDREPLRRALAALPEGRRESVVLSRHFWHGQEPKPGEPAVGGAWVIADLSPTAAVAAHVVAEVVSWTGGSAPYPEETAVDLLRLIGAPARPPIEAAITSGPKFVAVLERALEPASSAAQRCQPFHRGHARAVAYTVSSPPTPFHAVAGTSRTAAHWVYRRDNQGQNST